MKHIYSTVIILLLFQSFALAQSIRVSGRVIASDDRAPMPGVSIVVSGTRDGTVTNANGDFTVNVPSGESVLILSYVGYKTTEIAVQNRTYLEVALEPDMKQLKEVIVTAFGIEQEKRSLVSAAQQVTGNELLQAREANIVDALNAKVAGVQITRQGGAAGAGSNIVIRGYSSISGENQPLFVVDGIPINNSFRSTSRSSSVDPSNRALDINPNDIENITVLKGPAATALYGIQAGSGVVIITTKKGSRSDDRTVRVDFSSNASTERILKYFPGQMRYAQGDNGLFGDQTFNHFGPPLSTLRYNGNPATSSVADPRGRLVDMNDPSAIADAIQPPIDNQKAFYRDGFTFDNSINISSGTKNGSVMLAISNNKQLGIIPNNDFSRTSIRLAGESSLSDKLRMVASATYVKTDATKFGRGDNFSDVVQGTIRTPPSFDNSLGFLQPNGQQRSFRFNPNNPDVGSPDNPFWTANLNPFTEDVNRLIGFAQLFYDPLPWLNVMYRVGTDVSSDKRRQIWARGSTGGDGRFGRLLEDNYNDRIINSDLLVTATKKIGESKLTFLVGHNYFSTQTDRVYISGSNLAIPGLYNIANAQDNLVQIQNISRKKTAAALSRINLDVKDFFFIELTGRNEWTSTLESPNNSFFYGSVGSSFIFTDALQISGNAFSFGKFKASYAQAGRDAGPYTNQTFYNRGIVSGTWGGGIVFPLAGSGIGGVELSNVAGNPNLRPERNTTLELGAELRFIKNKVGFDITYYRALNTDQIIAVSVPGSTGFTNKVINAGEILNKGLEIVGDVKLVDKGTFSWDVIANFTRNRNEVLSLPVDRIPLGGFGNLRPQITVGEPFGVFFGTAFRRNAEGLLLLDDAGYPQIDLSGDKKIGDPTPDFLLGIRNNMRYKNFSLSFLWDIRVGGDVANVSTNWMRAQGVPNFTYDRGHLAIFRGVIESSGEINNSPVILDQAYYTGNAGNRNIAERFIEDGSWVRLRDVSISYAVPQAFTDKIKVRRMDIGIYGRNLLLFTPYTGIDPETNLYGPNSSFGIDAFGTPNTRSFGLNLNVSL